MKKTKINKIIIAGPCAAESKEQIAECLIQAKKQKIDFMRINLWKPRTKPGFDGLGEKGIPLLIEAVKNGVNPALEVILPSQAEKVIKAVFKIKSDTQILLWIGSRNQNHLIQKQIAQVAAKDKRVILMVKNQPWQSQDHWEGIIAHALSGGISPDNLLICHRGFVSNGKSNPHGFRNPPDLDMAMKVKKETKLPMIFDPSHVGGTKENVFLAIKEAKKYDFDGFIIEVHPHPENALTDAKQQLCWNELNGLIKNI